MEGILLVEPEFLDQEPKGFPINGMVGILLSLVDAIRGECESFPKGVQISHFMYSALASSVPQYKQRIATQPPGEEGYQW